MESIAKLLFDQIKQNCKTDLQKKQFLDWCGDWDYKEYYSLNEYDIDRSEALSDYIFKVMNDKAVMSTINSLMETGIQQNITENYKKRGLNFLSI